MRLRERNREDLKTIRTETDGFASDRTETYRHVRLSQRMCQMNTETWRHRRRDWGTQTQPVNVNVCGGWLSVSVLPKTYKIYFYIFLVLPILTVWQRHYLYTYACCTYCRYSVHWHCNSAIHPQVLRWPLKSRCNLTENNSTYPATRPVQLERPVSSLKPCMTPLGSTFGIRLPTSATC